MQWITQLVFVLLIRWIAIYPVDSAISLLNNWGQVVITHASHVSSQDSFGLPLRMNGMHRMESDHARLDLLSLVI